MPALLLASSRARKQQKVQIFLGPKAKLGIQPHPTECSDLALGGQTPNWPQKRPKSRSQLLEIFPVRRPFSRHPATDDPATRCARPGPARRQLAVDVPIHGDAVPWQLDGLARPSQARPAGGVCSNVCYLHSWLVSYFRSFVSNYIYIYTYKYCFYVCMVSPVFGLLLTCSAS